MLRSAVVGGSMAGQPTDVTEGLGMPCAQSIQRRKVCSLRELVVGNVSLAVGASVGISIVARCSMMSDYCRSPPHHECGRRVRLHVREYLVGNIKSRDLPPLPASLNE